MKKRHSVSMVFLVGLVSGCGADDSQSETPSPEECREFSICEPQGLPYVRAILPATDSTDPQSAAETMATVRQPEPGRACMAGRVDSGWAFLTLVFADFDENGLAEWLDAAGRGITSIQFKLDSPPSFGVNVQLVSLVPDCKESPLACMHWGFFLGGASPGSIFITNESGVVSAPLADFVKTASAEASWEFDPSHLATLQIGPGGVGAVTGEYDFCVSDLRFLDAEGNDVLPPS